MTSISDTQKQLIFDYCIGITPEAETEQAESLIANNAEAAALADTFKNTLSPLDSIDFEPCPSELAESTIDRLNRAAGTAHVKLEKLLASEQSYSSKSTFWRNVGARLAMAAMFMIVGSIFIAATNYARFKCRQLQCQANMASFYQGVENYVGEHDGKMPSVATLAGSPWWKVGDQGKENQSNTRHVWLLAKHGYVKPEDFLCPGSRHKVTLHLDPEQIKNLNDFPGRNYINYSFQIQCPKSQLESTLGKRVLMADMNPIFENLPKDFSDSLKIELDKELLNKNSSNHKQKGQNVLFCDGSVKFVRTRQVGISEDDIFTLRDVPVYQGVEVPSSSNDAFLAP